MLALRSLLFTTWIFATAILGGALELLIFWAPHRWKWAVAKAWADSNLWAGKFICGLDVATAGAENLPDEASVALIKHTTAMEAYWQIAALPPQTWVLKKELVLIPLFDCGAGLVMRPITIDRKAVSSVVKQIIAQGKTRIGRGLWLTLFPEGTRHAAGGNKALRRQWCRRRRGNRLPGGSGCAQRRRLLAETQPAQISRENILLYWPGN